MLARPIAFAAIFTGVSALCGCSADDAAADNDASTFDATLPACASIANFCAGALPGLACPSSLDVADDAATWFGTGSCTIYQSSNMCGGIDLSEAGIIVDAGDVLLDIAGTHLGLLLFYDSTSRQLVGAASFDDQVQQQCWGTLPPTYCAETTDAAACCDWSTGVLFQTFDAGVCIPLNDGISDAGDAGGFDAD